MKSIQDQQVGTRPGSTAGQGGGGGGGGGTKVWTITGRLRVRESELEGYPVDRPLKGIEVKVQASDVTADGPWSTWGAVRTGSDGSFSLSESNNGRSRFFRVQARLVSSDLVVEDGTMVDVGNLDLADRNWYTIWKSGDQRSGPAVDLGTRLVASGQPGELGGVTFRRQALIWYVLRTTIDRLTVDDPWNRLGDQLKVLYPAKSAVGTSYGSWNRIYLDEDQPYWKPDGVLFHFWRAWQDYHTSGSGKLGESFPSSAFASGFATFATSALMHELWDHRLERPVNRRYVAAGLSVSTLDEVERDPRVICHALHLLRYGGRKGWWSHLYGSAQHYPPNRPDDDGDGAPDHPSEVGVKERLDGRVVPAGPHHLTFWQILRTFRADAGHGWPTDLELGGGDYGLLRFIDRASAIHGLGEDVRELLRRSIDPLATVEPFELLPKAG